jgi:hypothetical protein
LYQSFADRWNNPSRVELAWIAPPQELSGPGVVAEWLNAAVLKTAERETVP